jgi:ferritin-like metal-binding protein YciE
MKNLEGLFQHFVKDMYHAEKQILRTLPKMARKAQSKPLKDALEHHREETETQIENLEKVFEQIGIKPRGVTCEAMQGILEEGKQMMDEAPEGDTLDAAMIASAQAVEHYEIARYGTMIAWANVLGMSQAARLLQENLKQEKAADDKLTTLAQRGVNQQAA